MAQFDSSNPQATLELGRIIGAKPPLKPKHVLGIRQQLKTSGKIRDLPLFSCAVDAKLRGCDLVKLRVSDVAPGGVLRHEQQSSSRKQGGPFRSRSPSRRGRRCQRGWRVAASAGTIGCFRADRAPATTSAPASTHVWSASGSRRSTWSRTPTVPTACGGRRWPSSTRRPATCARASCCLAIASWRARSAISASRWTTP